MNIKESISVFDILKIGIGPSSSHTLGPWKAALFFLKELKGKRLLMETITIRIKFYGSLAKTGRGHGSDLAVLMGLSGYDPETFPIDDLFATYEDIISKKQICLDGKKTIEFKPGSDFEFHFQEVLTFHANAMKIEAIFINGSKLENTYYSIGGGFLIKQDDQLNYSNPDDNCQENTIELPFPVNNASDLLHWCMVTGLSIHEIVQENENSWREEKATQERLLKIWKTMQDCLFRGMHREGELPGILHVKRRAAKLNRKLLAGRSYHNYESWIRAIRDTGLNFQNVLNWISCFALAVSEENASFGRVVTAPTNGAAGVLPAVLFYYVVFIGQISEQKIINFLLTASEIGSIFKKEATISGAMGGCQAEIGVSSAMAAGALTECLGGSQKQALMAAEIAMEHHLGLTCDPVAGLVQVPCIERNTMGAIKAIMASQLALQSTPDFAKVSLDKVIKTMWDTAQDMNQKYKETSDGGLAVNIPISLSEC